MSDIDHTNHDDDDHSHWPQRRRRYRHATDDDGKCPLSVEMRTVIVIVSILLLLMWWWRVWYRRRHSQLTNCDGAIAANDDVNDVDLDDDATNAGAADDIDTYSDCGANMFGFGLKYAGNYDRMNNRINSVCRNRNKAPNLTLFQQAGMMANCAKSIKTDMNDKGIGFVVSNNSKDEKARDLYLKNLK
jgi:hypothetical protein